MCAHLGQSVAESITNYDEDDALYDVIRYVVVVVRVVVAAAALSWEMVARPCRRCRRYGDYYEDSRPRRLASQPPRPPDAGLYRRWCSPRVTWGGEGAVRLVERMVDGVRTGR